MMRRKFKVILIPLLAIVIALTMSITTFAVSDDTIDFSKTGSITITLMDKIGHKVIPGATFTIYKVADVSSVDNNLIYVYTSDFQDNGMDLDDLNEEGLAAHLSSYAIEKNIEGISVTSDSDGKVIFSNISLGLYIIVQTGSVNEYYSVSPFLVSVPMTSGDGTSWIYAVDASPKTESRPTSPISENTKLTVNKMWKDDGIERPESVMVKLYRDCEEYESIRLNKDNGWSYTWEDLDRHYSWTVTESAVPEGYSVSYETTEKNVTIINTSDTSEEPNTPISPEPPLIQTGQLNWPIPVLATLGLSFFTLGWILTFIKRKDNHE